MADFHLQSRHFLVDEKGRIIIGEGRKEILETIERTGSINETAKIMKMSYKGVWSKLKATEDYMKVKIVQSNRKQGSSLTKEGKELLRNYRMLKEKCTKADDRIFKSIFNK
jgi:molybdate transport system regulatory protein